MLPERTARANADCRYADNVRQTTVRRPSVALALQTARENTTTPAIPAFQTAAATPRA
jgi:hypothetical protein